MTRLQALEQVALAAEKVRDAGNSQSEGLPPNQFCRTVEVGTLVGLAEALRALAAAEPVAPMDTQDEVDMLREDLKYCERELQEEYDAEPGSHRACHRLECRVKAIKLVLAQSNPDAPGRMEEN